MKERGVHMYNSTCTFTFLSIVVYERCTQLVHAHVHVHVYSIM